MSMREFMGWAALESVNPLPDQRCDLNFAHLLHGIARMLGGVRKSSSLMDFILPLGVYQDACVVDDRTLELKARLLASRMGVAGG